MTEEGWTEISRVKKYNCQPCIGREGGENCIYEVVYERPPKSDEELLEQGTPRRTVQKTVYECGRGVTNCIDLTNFIGLKKLESKLAEHLRRGH